MRLITILEKAEKAYPKLSHEDGMRSLLARIREEQPTLFIHTNLDTVNRKFIYIDDIEQIQNTSGLLISFEDVTPEICVNFKPLKRQQESELFGPYYARVVNKIENILITVKSYTIEAQNKDRKLIFNKFEHEDRKAIVVDDSKDFTATVSVNVNKLFIDEQSLPDISNTKISPTEQRNAAAMRYLREKLKREDSSLETQSMEDQDVYELYNKYKYINKDEIWAAMQDIDPKLFSAGKDDFLKKVISFHPGRPKK